MHSNNLKAYGKKCVCILFPSEVNYLTRFGLNYFCYIISLIIYALRVSIFMTSPLGVAVGLLSI